MEHHSVSCKNVAVVAIVAIFLMVGAVGMVTTITQSTQFLFFITLTITATLWNRSNSHDPANLQYYRILSATEFWALLSSLYFFANTSLLYGDTVALASKVAVTTVIIATIGSVLLFLMIRKKLLRSYLIGLSQFNLIYIIVLFDRGFVLQSSL
jgi:hypothetical protein